MGSEVQILSPRPNSFKSINYGHKRFALDAYFIGSRFHSASHMLFIISDLGTEMSPWGKTRWSDRGSGRQRASGLEPNALTWLLAGDFTPVTMLQ